MSTVLIKTLDLPPICEKEALRYAGVRQSDEQTLTLLRQCIDEITGKCRGKVCYSVLDLTITDSEYDLGVFKLVSKDLAKTLDGCDMVLVFAATVGIDADRLISKYSRISPTRALMFQAIGAERIEALCDAFCAEFAREEGVILAPRFSAGYGDLSIETQKDIFTLLDPPKRIGLSLTDSLLMSPTKSVTAFVGIKRA